MFDFLHLSQHPVLLLFNTISLPPTFSLRPVKSPFHLEQTPYSHEEKLFKIKCYESYHFNLLKYQNCQKEMLINRLGYKAVPQQKKMHYVSKTAGNQKRLLCTELAFDNFSCKLDLTVSHVVKQ